MRVKTDAKRHAIMAAAADIFRESGYERTSMAMIAARVGGSKTTLYSYFPSKEELFAAVMMDVMREQAEPMYQLVATTSADLRATLLQFCKAYITFLLVPDVLNCMRIGIAEGANSDLGRQFFDRSPKDCCMRVAKFLSDSVGAKQLRDMNPSIAALQLQGLIEAGLLLPSLFGAEPLFSQDIIIEAAVDTFLRSYAAI